jgi:hypothetical protein
MKNKISNTKNEITKILVQATKSGNMNLCLVCILKSDQCNNIKQYCTNSYPNDPINYDLCIVPDKFCRVCCQNEFGDLHLQERETCDLKCGEINL